MGRRGREAKGAAHEEEEGERWSLRLDLLLYFACGRATLCWLIISFGKVRQPSHAVLGVG